MMGVVGDIGVFQSRVLGALVFNIFIYDLDFVVQP